MSRRKGKLMEEKKGGFFKFLAGFNLSMIFDGNILMSLSCQIFNVASNFSALFLNTKFNLL